MNWFKFSQLQSTAVKTYSIKPGDTLIGIARNILGDDRRWQEIQNMNPGINPKSLQVGQVINIPSNSTQAGSVQPSPNAPAQNAVPAATQNTTNPANNSNNKSNANSYKMSNLKSTIMQSEGFRSKSYFDPPSQRENKAVGYGFNLSRKDAEKLLSNLNLDLKAVFNGNQSVSREQAEYLLDEAIKVATYDAINYIPNFRSYPETVQAILVDMSYNLGGPRLSKFTKMINALDRKDYNRAAEEMLDSKWAIQVGGRAKRLADIMRSVS